jgi:hypothetical protein
VRELCPIVAECPPPSGTASGTGAPLGTASESPLRPLSETEEESAMESVFASATETNMESGWASVTELRSVSPAPIVTGS